MKGKLVFLALLAAVAALAVAVAPGSAEKQSSQGTFRANLSALNAGTHTDANGNQFMIPAAGGTATVNVTGDDVTVTIMVHGVVASVVHPQHIHAGTICPDASDDTNHDGYVDVIEGLPKYGPILVNLDSNLENPGVDAFPVADGSGSYTYNESAIKSHLQDELQQALKLATRHVVIHGIGPTPLLPSTVATLPGLSANNTLPVACGELHRTG